MAYIDVDKARKHLRVDCLAKYPTTYIDGLLAASNEIYNIPAADVEEVKHGHWMDNIKTISTVGTPNIKALVGYKCSECGRAEVCKEPYCNCGAKMDGGEIHNG